MSGITIHVRGLPQGLAVAAIRWECPSSALFPCDRNPIPLGAYCHRDTVGPHETCFVVSSWIQYYVRVVGRIRKLSMSSGRTRDLDLPALAPKIEWNLALGAQRPGSRYVRGGAVRFADVGSSNRFRPWIHARN